MTIREIMTTDVRTISPDITIEKAAGLMTKYNVGVLPVGENDRLVGMLTDRDIIVRGLAEGLSPKKTKVRKIMSDEVIWCFEDQDISEAASLMKEKRVRRLIVLNREKRLSGICSLGDLVVDSHNYQLGGEVLEKVSESYKHH
jgi:CBS domain-containing protein